MRIGVCRTWDEQGGLDYEVVGWVDAPFGPPWGNGQPMEFPLRESVASSGANLSDVATEATIEKVTLYVRELRFPRGHVVYMLDAGESPLEKLKRIPSWGKR